jgi:hypothetical protein
VRNCLPEDQYRTPPGYYDRFFVYAYNADALVDSIAPATSDYRGLSVQIEASSDFIMRKVSGAPQVVMPCPPLAPPPVGRVQLYNSVGAKVSGDPLNANHYRSSAVVPELRYPAGSAIVFDLYGVLRAVHLAGASAGGVTFLSQLAFHGVERARGRADTESSYRYYEKPYIYHFPLVIDWTAYVFDAAGLVVGVRPPHQFYLEVNNSDFELHQIVVTVTNTGAIPWAAGTGSTLAYMMLYDQNNRACSNVPLWMNFLEANSPDSFGNVITPPLLYRVGSYITFDIHSRCLALDLPLNLDIDFVGVRRLPC